MKQSQSDQLFDMLVRRSEHGALVDLWLATHYDQNEHDIEDQMSFRERQEIFLWALGRLLRDGRIKLHSRGVIREASVDEQINAFRQAFPESDDDADRICTKPGHEVPYKGFGMNVWWFLDVCPAGVAWRQSDGSYQIAD